MIFLRNRLFKKYLIEFFSMVFAILSAFYLNNWNAQRKDNIAANKILKEIYNGLNEDLQDLTSNMNAHKSGIKACEDWAKMIDNYKLDEKSISYQYLLLTRDFISMQNKSGYEALKAKGLEIIKNDSLRKEIISLYEYDYNILYTLEEQYSETQFFSGFFHPINNILSHSLEFDSNGNFLTVRTPLNLSDQSKNLYLSYLWRIKMGHQFILIYYQNTIENLKRLREKISKILKEQE